MNWMFNDRKYSSGLSTDRAYSRHGGHGCNMKLKGQNILKNWKMLTEKAKEWMFFWSF